MDQTVNCGLIQTPFSDYSQEQWRLLVEQSVEKYGHYILERDFDFESPRLKQSVTENRRCLINYFRMELENREKQQI